MMADFCPRYSYALFISLPLVLFIVVFVEYVVFFISPTTKVQTDSGRVLLRILNNIRVLKFTLEVVI